MLVADFVGHDGKPTKTLAVTADSEPLYRIVEVGTEAKVVRDDGPVEKVHRDITVRLVEGNQEGLVGTVSRSNCRPAK